MHLKFFSATFAPYKPATDDATLVANGFVAGTGYYKNPAYIGRGDNSGNKGLKPCPAIIYKGNGAWMSGLTSGVYDTSTAEYLPAKSNYFWIKANITNAFDFVNGVQWTAGNYSIVFARFNITSLNYTAIGHVRERFEREILLINIIFRELGAALVLYQWNIIKRTIRLL